MIVLSALLPCQGSSIYAIPFVRVHMLSLPPLLAPVCSPGLFWWGLFVLADPSARAWMKLLLLLLQSKLFYHSFLWKTFQFYALPSSMCHCPFPWIVHHVNKVKNEYIGWFEQLQGLWSARSHLGVLFLLLIILLEAEIPPVVRQLWQREFLSF